jgi:hypothetical protein
MASAVSRSAKSNEGANVIDMVSFPSARTEDVGGFSACHALAQY